jgi:hypothetical protein
MKLFTLVAALVAVTAIATSALAAPAPGAAASRQFEGKVVSLDRDAKTFRLHDSERGTKLIKVTRNTRFERIAGFAGLKKGQRNIEATVKRRDGRWIAIEVEKSGGGGEHADDRGGDDNGGRGRGTDDPPGDDRGGDR